MDGRVVDERALFWGQSFLRVLTHRRSGYGSRAALFGVKKPALVAGSERVPFTKVK